MKNVILYTGEPLISTWAERWGLSSLIEHGFNVIHWDASNIYYEAENKLKFFSGSKFYRFNVDNTEIINNYSNLEYLASKTNSNDLLWILNRGPIDYSFKNDDLKILNKYSLNYIVGHLFTWQYPKLTNSYVSYVKKLIRHRIGLSYLKLKNHQKKPNLIISSGKLGRYQVMKTMPYMRNNIFSFRAPNYFSAPSYKVLWNKSKRVIGTKYIVYVDEAPVFAPDSELRDERVGWDDMISPLHNIERFFKKMNEFFDKIENWSGFSIIIAASGKYTYQENPFNDRKIIYQNTLGLIQHAEIIIGHKSVALDQAIIERKPVLLLMNDEFPIIKNQQILESAKIYHNKDAINPENIKKEDYINCYNVNYDYYKNIELDYFREVGVTGTFAENIINCLETL